MINAISYSIIKTVGLYIALFDIDYINKIWHSFCGNFETSNCESLNKAVLSGVGVALRPKWDVWRYIEKGSLVQLLTGYIPPQYNIQVVYPSRNYLPQRVSLFIEFLKLSLSHETGWNISQ